MPMYAMVYLWSAVRDAEIHLDRFLARLPRGSQARDLCLISFASWVSHYATL